MNKTIINLKVWNTMLSIICFILIWNVNTHKKDINNLESTLQEIIEIDTQQIRVSSKCVNELYNLSATVDVMDSVYISNTERMKRLNYKINQVRSHLNMDSFSN